MTTPKQSVPAPLKVAVFLKLGAVRLTMVLIVFLIFWGTGWVPVATAAQIAGLLGLVVLGMTGYEVFVSSVDRPGTGFVIVTSVGNGTALARSPQLSNHRIAADPPAPPSIVHLVKLRTRSLRLPGPAEGRSSCGLPWRFHRDAQLHLRPNCTLDRSSSHRHCRYSGLRSRGYREIRAILCSVEFHCPCAGRR